MRQKKKQLSKKNLNYLVVDLDNLTADLTLSKCLTDFVRGKHKRPVKVLNKEGQFNEFWIKDLLPRWQEIWYPRCVNIKYNRKQKSFFITALR